MNWLFFVPYTSVNQPAMRHFIIQTHVNRCKIAGKSACKKLIKIDVLLYENKKTAVYLIDKVISAVFKHKQK